ncbi:MAG: hypothetical protein ACUVTD_08330 [Nitrososphaerales archaeon]
MKYREAYQTIRELVESLRNLNGKLPTFLVGFSGELLVKSKLMEDNIPFTSKGGQAGFDIVLKASGKKIEVRSSLLKNEGIYPEDVMFHEWRIKDRDKEEKYDYLVCVAFNEGLTNPRFYIFTKEEAMKAGDVDIPRFRKVQKKLHLFRSLEEMEKAIKERPDYVTEWERQVNQSRSKYENRWEILK